MKNTEILSIVNTLNQLDYSKTSMPVKVGYTILKNRQKMRQVIEPFEEIRNGIFKKYANGKQSLQPTDEGYAECLEEMNALNDEETELELEKIKLTDIEKLELSADMISALMCMLEE